MNDDWRYEEPDDEDDVYSGDDYATDEFGDTDDSTITRPCPNCGTDIYEDAPSCSACGEWVDWSTAAASRKVWWAQQQPTWWVYLGLAGILATIWALLS